MAHTTTTKPAPLHIHLRGRESGLEQRTVGHGRAATIHTQTLLSAKAEGDEEGGGEEAKRRRLKASRMLRFCLHCFMDVRV